MSIAENIQSVRARIDAAARAAGRDPGEITLVGASKMNDADACRQAIAAGIDVLGENRVQEMLASTSSTPTTVRRCTSSAICSATRSARSWARWP
jgi:uncharacterized pyridoxal phosphate-containing UPF0001 family protein